MGVGWAITELVLVVYKSLNTAEIISVELDIESRNGVAGHMVDLLQTLRNLHTDF